MAKNFLRNAETQSLRRRKKSILQRLMVPEDAVRASYVAQLTTCGKKNCRCRNGYKHGPFHYLVQCLGVGKVHKFLLKTNVEKQRARAGIAAYATFQKCLEELSRINTELLRRGELLDET